MAICLHTNRRQVTVNLRLVRRTEFCLCRYALRDGFCLPSHCALAAWSCYPHAAVARNLECHQLWLRGDRSSQSALCVALEIWQLSAANLCFASNWLCCRGLRVFRARILRSATNIAANARVCNQELWVSHRNRLGVRVSSRARHTHLCSHRDCAVGVQIRLQCGRIQAVWTHRVADSRNADEQPVEAFCRVNVCACVRPPSFIVNVCHHEV